MFEKVLVANRGEIAVRVIRALREMGIASVAVYSEADRDSLHVMLADEAICIGPAASSDSYLNMEAVISAAVASKAQAIHPGYGFLSENEKFASLCETCGIKFIGPSSQVIARMGNKSEAKNTMIKAGVPVVPGSREPIYSSKEAKRIAKKTGYPVMIKAALGGGGKGIRVAESEDRLEEMFLAAQFETRKAFGDDTMYIERYVKDPRHIEVQILADSHGNVIHLGERDCSIQRRHQKVLEESPCENISPALRSKLGRTAVKAAKAVGYENAGTIEFLLEPNGKFYFMEMNTRVQVEHPVTELVSGVDIIKEQIRIAAGEKLSFTQKDIRLSGHAIECRINAESPERGFMPSPGTITNLHFPGGNGIRIDTHVYQGYKLPPYYDSMIAKLIAYGKDRDEAVRKLRSALGETIIDGIDTNIDFAYELIKSPAFEKGHIDTGFIEKHFPKYLKK